MSNNQVKDPKIRKIYKITVYLKFYVNIKSTIKNSWLIIISQLKKYKNSKTK